MNHSLPASMAHALFAKAKIAGGGTTKTAMALDFVQGAADAEGLAEQSADLIY
jgi:hypothetical protein